jgi:hypothetical protein
MIFLEEAVELVPSVTPRVFESALGHSIQSMTTTKEAGGTFLTMPWLERWQETTEGVLLWIALAGALWAIVNLCRRRAWVLNSAAVARVAVRWIVGHAFVM